MKHLLQTIGNLFYWFYFSFFSLCGILWYGKLPKVSMYHRVMRNSLYKIKDIYNDTNSQILSVDDVPKGIQDKIIFAYLERLYKDDVFKANLQSINIPIFDGKKIIGNESVYGTFRKNV
jgi:hypothetical protein